MKDINKRIVEMREAAGRCQSDIGGFGAQPSTYYEVIEMMSWADLIPPVYTSPLDIFPMMEAMAELSSDEAVDIMQIILMELDEREGAH
jgi:hypothetical protein